MAEMKQQEQKIQKADCGAILIASSAASNAADISARVKCDKTEKGNLVGTVADIGNMQSVFVRSGAIDIVKTFCETPNHAKRSDVLREIRSLFRDRDRKSFILYYSGHGKKLQGDWCFEKGNGSQINEYITLNDILAAFNHYHNQRQNLIIISDCCFSGAWVRNLEQRRVRNVYMQASCRSNQTCSDGRHGGVFTTKYMDKSTILYKKQHSKLWAIPGFFTSLVGAVVLLIKDIVVLGLYDLATKDFKPIFYYHAHMHSKDLGSVYVGTHKDGNHTVGIVMYSNWYDINREETEDVFVGYAWGRAYV
eukprot:381152_1